MKRYFIIVLITQVVLNFSCKKPDNTITTESEENIVALISNLGNDVNTQTVVCTNQSQEIKISLSSKMPSKGILINCELKPTLETSDATIKESYNFTSGVSYTIPLNNKIRKGEIYLSSITLKSNSNTTNLLTISDFKVVWQ